MVVEQEKLYVRLCDAHNQVSRNVPGIRFHSAESNTRLLFWDTTIIRKEVGMQNVGHKILNCKKLSSLLHM